MKGPFGRSYKIPELKAYSWTVDNQIESLGHNGNDKHSEDDQEEEEEEDL